MRKAVGVLKELSADERTRMLYEDREKARRDTASRMDGARREGRLEGLLEGRREQVIEFARNAISMNFDIGTIIKLTGLTREEVEALQA